MHESPPPRGTVAPGVESLIWLSCVVTAVVAMVGMDHLWSYRGEPPFWDAARSGWYYEDRLEPYGFWVRNGLPIGIVLWLAAISLPPWSLSRAVRVAVLLPVAHAVALIGVVIASVWVSTLLPELDDSLHLVDALPMVWVAGGAAILYIAGGWLAAPRRRGEWLHGTVMLAL